MRLLLLFAVCALAGCRDAPVGPGTGGLNVTPVGLVPCPYWSSPTGSFSQIQQVDCGNF